MTLKYKTAAANHQSIFGILKSHGQEGFLKVFHYSSIYTMKTFGLSESSMSNLKKSFSKEKNGDGLVGR